MLPPSACTTNLHYLACHLHQQDWGVPVRVVVGYPAPPADTATEYRVEELTAWVETPIDEVGWIALDVVPTPAEQQRQAELAAETPRDPPPPPPPPPRATNSPAR